MSAAKTENEIHNNNELELRKKSTSKQDSEEAARTSLFRMEAEDEALIEAFIVKYEERVQKELQAIRKNIVAHNAPDHKRLLFLFAVAKAENEMANSLIRIFKAKVLDISLPNDFEYSSVSREDFKDNQEILTNVMKTCVAFNYPIIAREILMFSNYYKCDEELLKLCIDNDFFPFLRDLMKKTKEYLQDQTKKNFSNSSRISQVQSYKAQFLHSLSITIQNVLEKNAIFWQEHDRANDNIQKCLLRKEEKIAIKLMVHYFSKFSQNFIKYSVLDFAIVNQCYLFVKKYFDIYPRTRYRIREFGTINHVVEILDDEECFLDGIFLLSKVNTRALNEIHVRMIIDRYWMFLKEKLMLITFTLNPILVCVQIIENLKAISKNYSNVRIKLKMIIDEFLKLASMISDQISDEIIYKTILLKIFFPSQMPLLKILYSDKHFYMELLKSELIVSVVSKLWFCQYNWTFNFLNSSSAFKNLTTHFGNEGNFINPQAWRFKVSKMAAGASKSRANKRISLIEKDEQKVDYSMKPIGLMVYNKTANGGFVGIADFNVNMKDPFEFYKKTRFSKDVRMDNHILSYFFFENSPAFKVVLEFLIYMAFFSIIIWTLFNLFSTRRYFDRSSQSLLYFSDGLGALNKGKDGTPTFWAIMANYSTTHQVSLLEAFGSFKGKGAVEVTRMVLPWLGDEIPAFYEKSEQVWERAKILWVLNLYFFTTFLQDILEMIFYYKKMRKVAITGKFLIDFSLISINIFYFIYFFTELDNDHLIIQNKLIEKFEILEKTMTIFMFIMWFKFVFYLKLTKRFGIVVKVIENMSFKLGIFMVVLCVVILAFATVCFYLFDGPNPEQFGTFWITLRTLIQFLFGNVDLSGFDSSRVLAGIVLNIYSFLLFVLLLNLIIAILSSGFNNVSERGNLENATTLFFHYHLRKPDKYYSMLTSLAPPFNVLVLFFLPFIFRRNSKLNKICTIIGYVIYSGIFVFLYTFANILIVIPLCKLRLLVTVIINVIIKRKIYLKGAMVWMLWAFGGIFYMLWVLFIHDLPLFIKSMYYPCLIKDRLDEITMEEIQLIDSQCKILIEGGKYFITHGELTELIKTDLERINKKFRRKSLLEQRNKAWNILQTLVGKDGERMGLGNRESNKNSSDKSNSDSPGFKRSMANMNLGENIENEINVFVEVDKMEVFSFLRQFNGINGMIDLKRFRFLISQIKLCKKFNLMKISKTKQNKLINVIQVVEMLQFEKSVVAIMGEQVRNSKLFENVLKKFIC